MITIGHVNIGNIFLCIGNSKLCFYEHSVKSTACWLVDDSLLENNEKATLDINMPYSIFRFVILLSLLVSSSYAAYSTNTDSLYTSLQSCANEVGSDKQCVADVQEALENMSDYIQKVSAKGDSHVEIDELKTWGQVEFKNMGC